MATVVDSNNFDAEVRNSSDVVLVDFFAPWCGPCQALVPIIEELSGELPEGQKITKLNVDDAPDLAGEFGVVSIPTIKIFKGGEVVQEFMGVQDKDVLKEALASHAA